MTLLEQILLCSSILFLILWLWQSILLARTTRALESATLTNSKYELAYATLEQMKSQLEVQQIMIKDLQNLNDFISSNNHRITELAERMDTYFKRLADYLKLK